MSVLKRFAPKPTKRVEYNAKTWLVHGHYRNSNGDVSGVTASFVRESKAKHLRLAEVQDPIAVHLTCFAQPPTAAKTIDLGAFRKVLGRATWTKTRWTPQPRKVLGHVFDLVLVRRALACAPKRGVASLEVAPFVSVGGHDGYLLRVVGDGWRVIIGGRIEKKAKPVALRTALVRSTGTRKDNG